MKIGEIPPSPSLTPCHLSIDTDVRHPFTLEEQPHSTSSPLFTALHQPIALLPPERYKQPDPTEFQDMANGLLLRIGGMIYDLEQAHHQMEQGHMHTLKEVHNQTMHTMQQQMDYQHQLEKQQRDYTFWDTCKHMSYTLLATCSTITGATVLATAAEPLAIAGGLALVSSGLSSIAGTALSITHTAPEAALALNIASIPLGLAGGLVNLDNLPAAAQFAKQLGYTTVALAGGTADIAQATIPVYQTRAKTVQAEKALTAARTHREEAFATIADLRNTFHDIHRQCVMIQQQEQEANRIASSSA